jgi:protein-S-isoprenylcysteine O-methyltransferase Ste14
MGLTIVLRTVIWIWPISEVVLGVVSRAGRRGAEGEDRGSVWLIWGVIVAGVALAVWLHGVRSAVIVGPSVLYRSAALVLIVGGLIIRWVAVVTLGRYFTSTVSIQSGHRLVRSGLYGMVRHPSYSGLLIAFIGLGLSFTNWASLAAVTVPVTAAVCYRIRVEERALGEAFGREYADYCDATKRLIPHVY